jgi:hypothetical protein
VIERDDHTVSVDRDGCDRNGVKECLIRLPID